MKRNIVGIVAAVAAVGFAQVAEAQICAGFPSSERGFYFGARADFPEDLDSFGVEANYNAAGPLGIYGGLNVISLEGFEDSDFNFFNVGVAFEVASLGAFIGPQVSVCPVVEFHTTDLDDTGYAIPIGLGFGGDLGTPALSIQPYAVPQLFIINSGGTNSENSTEFGFRGGVMVGLGMFTVGGELQHIFEENSDPVFGIRAGIRL